MWNERSLMAGPLPVAMVLTLVKAILEVAEFKPYLSGKPTEGILPLETLLFLVTINIVSHSSHHTQLVI